MNIAEKILQAADNTPKVFEAGKKAEYDAFWDTYQTNGERSNYGYAFAYYGWTEDSFKPKYDMLTVNSIGIFMYSRIKVDLVEYLEKLGIKLEFSSTAASKAQIFFSSWFTRIGIINVENAASMAEAFRNMPYLETIDELVVNEVTNFHDTTFRDCKALKNLKITGSIATTLDLQWCPLTKASIESVINALAVSPNISRPTVTFSLNAVKNAFETSTGAADGHMSPEWEALILKKPAWNIYLV